MGSVEPMPQGAETIEHGELAPIGRMRGEPILEVPQDLFIPPDALEVFLETFEGPLDLLLYLIRRQNLDVLDIPMAELTKQYMGYVEMMRTHQLELAAEYLLMAALLVEIKSRMLLPKPRHADREEDDPRAALVQRLLAYEQMKLASRALDELPRAGRDFSFVQAHIEQMIVTRLPAVSADDLKAAWLALLGRASVHRHHRVTREQLSVRDHMTRILRRLQDQRFAAFVDLFRREAGVAELVVTFLAVLELARESLIEVQQQAAYAPIYVRLRDACAAV
ncbi:MAG: segregation/condensation protein A [Betaproteobacteria bacterium]|nr:segregation/condensation protein A [Betaproteobacteria bacterium]